MLTPPTIENASYIFKDPSVTINFAFKLVSEICLDEDIEYTFDYQVNVSSFDTANLISVNTKTQEMSWSSETYLSPVEIVITIKATIQNANGQQS